MFKKLEEMNQKLQIEVCVKLYRSHEAVANNKERLINTSFTELECHIKPRPNFSSQNSPKRVSRVGNFPQVNLLEKQIKINFQIFQQSEQQSREQMEEMLL